MECDEDSGDGLPGAVGVLASSSFPLTPMRVVILSSTYHPDHTGSAVYATDLASFLHQRGHDVTVITSFPHYPSWKKRVGDRGVLFRSDEQDGVRVLRAYTYVPGRVTAWTRILYETTFLASAGLVAL